MEYNQCVIMERYLRNQLLARIEMTRNRMLPLTMKPTEIKDTVLVVGKTKYTQLDTAFIEKKVLAFMKEEKVVRTILRRKKIVAQKFRKHFNVKYRMILGYDISYLDI